MGNLRTFDDVDTMLDRPRWPDSGIFLITCILPMLSTAIFGAVDNTTWIIITALWAATLLMWIVESWVNGEFRFSDHPLQTPLYGFLFIGLFQLLPLAHPTDGNSDLSIAVSNTISLDPHSTRFFISRLVVYITFFAACLSFIRTDKRLRKVVTMIVVFGSFIAFFAILQRLANPEGIYGMRETPQAVPFGPFVNQHHFASLMQMTGGITLSFLFGNFLKRDKKVLLAIAFTLMGVATVLTSSRGGLIGFLTVVLLLSVFKISLCRDSKTRKRDITSENLLRTLGLPAATGALLLLVLGVVLFVGGESSLLRGIGLVLPDSDITTGRSYFWSIALKMFIDHPLLGVGWDAFGVAFTPYDTQNGYFRVEQAHNEYLQVLAEGGIPGFLCLSGFIYLLSRQSLKTIAGSSGIVREAAQGALAGCFGIIVHSFFDFPLRTPSNAFFFLLLCAIAVFPISRPKAS
jgi:O-antigen ligase